MLEQVEPQSGARTDLVPVAAPSRKQAASDAGMSHRQMHTALRVANVPSANFDNQVESDDPPTIPKLAHQGTKPRAPILDLKARLPRISPAPYIAPRKPRKVPRNTGWGAISTFQVVR